MPLGVRGFAGDGFAGLELRVDLFGGYHAGQPAVHHAVAEEQQRRSFGNAESLRKRRVFGDVCEIAGLAADARFANLVEERHNAARLRAIAFAEQHLVLFEGPLSFEYLSLY